jgi:hypothetical protein
VTPKEKRDPAKMSMPPAEPVVTYQTVPTYTYYYPPTYYYQPAGWYGQGNCQTNYYGRGSS